MTQGRTSCGTGSTACGDRVLSLVLMGVAGLLIGGAFSLRGQDFPRWVWIAFLVLAGLSLVAAYLFTLPGD